jgi:hypothetical protein
MSETELSESTPSSQAVPPTRRWMPLAGARMPADRGMSGLGLVLQLGGSVFAAITALFGALQLLELAELSDRYPVGRTMLWILALTAVGVVRSAAHRAAGTELLYSTQSERPIAGIRRYVGLAIAHTALVVVFLAGDAPVGVIVSIGLALLAWPAILLVIVQRVLRVPGARSDVGALPLAEDKGFEGAAVLMTLLGLCGVLFTATALVGIVDMPGRAATGPGVFLLVIVVMLLLRSALHVHAGWRGLHEVHVDRAVEATNRYADFAVITAFVTGGIFLVVLMMQQSGVQGLVYIGGIAWLLLAWPLVLRRFFSERQFADLMAGDQAPVHRRAPDQGLTALGWLLLAIGGVGLALYLPTAVLAGSDLFTPFAGEAGRSPWWNVGIHALALWAGIELVRMSDHHRLATTLFGVIATAANLYQYVPALRGLDGLAAHVSPGAGASGMVAMGQLAVSLVPIAAVLLVNRAHVPIARASFRKANRPA